MCEVTALYTYVGVHLSYESTLHFFMYSLLMIIFRSPYIFQKSRSHVVNCKRQKGDMKQAPYRVFTILQWPVTASATWRFLLDAPAVVDCVWNVMAHEPDLVFQRKGRVNLNRRGRQFSRLLAAEVCTSAVVMLDTPCSEVVWRVLATHSIRQFPLHFPSRVSPGAITFQLDSTHFFM